MAISYKILGQSQPASTANTDLYTVSAGKQAIVSSLVITNTTGAAASARVFIRKAGATAAVGNAILYDVAIAAASVAGFTLGITLDATDVITVRSGAGNDLTFQAFGSEIS
jgi:hypothetical protein